MRVNSILPVYFSNHSKNTTLLKTKGLSSPDKSFDKPSFKGTKGTMAGGLLGMLGGAIVALSCITPVGIAAAITYTATTLGGTILGGKIGDKIEGEDKEDK